MARGSNQKGKLLQLERIFREETDEAHGLTMPQLLERLRALDIPADRRTVYQDLEELRRCGLDIIAERDGRQTSYRLASREFELAELKLLVDSVQAYRHSPELSDPVPVLPVECGKEGRAASGRRLVRCQSLAALVGR